MNSVERLMNYTDNLPQEPAARLGSDPSPAMWPTRGQVVLRNIDAAYPSRPEKLVLRNVNLTFRAGETVFIVGRTGSGKSTLLSLLLRMIDPSAGSVEIDGRGMLLFLLANVLSKHISRHDFRWIGYPAAGHASDSPRHVIIP